MSSSISVRLDESRRRLVRAGVIRGAAICLVAGVVGAACAGGADWAVRSDHPAWRLAVTLAATAPAVSAAWRLLVPPLRDRVSLLEVARRVETSDPTWGGGLSAATAFSEGGEASGSRDIRAEIIGRAERQLDSRPLPDLADRSPVRRSLVWASLCGVFALAGLAFAPSAAVTAVERIALPLADVRWPRRVDLVLVGDGGEPLPATLRVGRGETLRFMVVNRLGDVPEDLALEIVPARGGRRSEPVSTAEERPDGGPKRVVGSGSLFATEGPIRFRAVGGDHRVMPFVTAQVVPVPELQSVSLTVTPPAYLGAEAVHLREARDVAVVVGSTISLRGRANKRLSAASLVVGGPSEVPAAIGEDGRTVTATFHVATAGVHSYSFRLRDEVGVESGEPARYEVRAQPDSLPQVRLTEPPEDVRATAVADLPVIVEATDDHGLTWARLRFARGAPQFEGESAAPPADTALIALSDGAEKRAAGTFRLVWSLGPLGLVPGDRLSFRGEAGDGLDGESPHFGVSSPRTLSIVSDAEKREELLDREAGLLGRLRLVRRDFGQVAEAIEELSAVPAADLLGREERDRVARADAEQRRLRMSLVEPERGFQAEAERMRLELLGNGLDDEAMAERLGGIVRGIGRLGEALPATDRATTAAVKADGGDEAASALAAAARELDVVLGGLDSLLAELGTWRSRQELGSELTDLLSVQRELSAQTEEAAAQTLGAAAGQLSDAQVLDLERLGLRQAAVADRLEGLEKAIEQGADAAAGAANPDETGPGGTGDLAEFLTRAGLPAAARAAGESIRGNELGEARRLQKDIYERLRELRDLLSRPEVIAEGESLREEVARLDRIAAEQGRMAETLREAANSPRGVTEEDRRTIGDEQDRLREETLRAERRLDDVAVDTSAAPLRAVVKSMTEAIERLARRDDHGAAQAAGEAAERLAAVRERVAEAAGAQERHLAMESVAAWAGQAVALAERQGGLNSEMARLHEIKSEVGRLSRSQLRTLRQAADAQRAVVEETTALANRVKSAPALELAFRAAAARMARCAVALDGGEVGSGPQGDGAAAKDMLDRVAAAFRLGRPERGAGSEESPGESNVGPPGEGVPVLAQLELLKGVQEDLLRRTEAVDAARTSEPTSVDAAELVRLGEEQAALTEVLGRLLDQGDSEGREE